MNQWAIRFLKEPHLHLAFVHELFLTRRQRLIIVPTAAAFFGILHFLSTVDGDHLAGYWWTDLSWIYESHCRWRPQRRIYGTSKMTNEVADIHRFWCPHGLCSQCSFGPCVLACDANLVASANYNWSRRMWSGNHYEGKVLVQLRTRRKQKWTQTMAWFESKTAKANDGARWADFACNYESCCSKTGLWSGRNSIRFLVRSVGKVNGPSMRFSDGPSWK